MPLHIRFVPGQAPTHYTIAELRQAHPNVSFPSAPSDGCLSAYGVYPLSPTSPPSHDPYTQVAEELVPLLIDGVWTQQWAVRDLTAEELQVRVPQSVTRLQGMLAIADAGLAQSFLDWKAGLDPVADFAALAFLESAQTWNYEDPLLNAALVTLGVAEQKDALFTLAATL